MKPDDTKPEAAASQEDQGTCRTLIEILHDAVRARASDVHMESLQGGRVRVRYRIDGVLHEVAVLPEGSADGVITRLKTMAGLDVAQRRLPQDGRIPLRVDGRDCDVRLSILPTVHGERATCRILRPEVLDLRLERIELSPENLVTVRRLCQAPQGIVVVNGPTGCGKTTLLYSMLQEIDQVRTSVMTVEDPVEYAFERVSQVQVRSEIGLTFARAIRSILRQDPDVILVGEIRDRETLELCVQVAMTGHLVMTALHASTCAEAVRRMLDIGLLPFMLNASLKAVISQRLIRRLCPQCRQPEPLKEEALPEQARAIVRQFGQVSWYGPKGCEECSGTGYRGRTTMHEILVMNDPIRQVVSADGTVGQIREAAIATGMKTMLEDGLAKAAQGITSVKEVLRVEPTGI